MILSTELNDGPRIIDVSDRIERRNCKRIQVLGATDGVLIGSHLNKWVQIVNISKGGLAFCYVASQGLLKGSFELDILSDHIGLSLEKLIIEVTSDIQIGRELFLGFIPVRRCGARFTDLTVDQIRELDYFMGESGLCTTKPNIGPVFYDEAGPVKVRC